MKKNNKLAVLCLLITVVASVFFAGCSDDKDSSKDKSSKKALFTDESKETTKEKSTQTKKETTTTKSKDSSKADNSKDSYKAGKITANGFESSYLNLKFALPDGFTMSNQSEIDKMTQAGANIASSDLNVDKDDIDAALSKVIYEMVAKNSTGTANVMLFAEKAQSPLVNDAQTYLEVIKNQLNAMTTIKYKCDDKISEVTIGGQKFTKLSATASTNGVTLNQDYYCMKKGERMVCMALTYINKADGDKMLKAFSALK